VSVGLGFYETGVMMNSHEVVNLVIKKFGGSRVKFEAVGITFVDFVLGGNDYQVTQAAPDQPLIVQRKESDLKVVTDDYSRWVEGVLNGLVRDNDGKMVPKVEAAVVPKKQVLMIDAEYERKTIVELSRILKHHGYDASNSTLVAVSSDYSSIAWQVLRHDLSHDGEVCDGFTVDVPYPDQKWLWHTSDKILNAYRAIVPKENLIFIEAGVIRGSNYKCLTNLFETVFPNQKVVTATLFENTHSAFKSMFVAEYYDDTVSDLTFWWETYNKHWK
jgi:hypothetical protein